MKYSDLENGFAYFTDFETQKVIQDPVYFRVSNNEISIVYERATVEMLFAKIDKEKCTDHTYITKTPEDFKLLMALLKKDEKLRKIIEEKGKVHLNGYPIGDLLTKWERLDSRWRSELNATENHELTALTIQLSTAFSAAKAVCNEAANSVVCPKTQTRLWNTYPRGSAVLFKNVFLIAARNAIEADPNEFQGKPFTDILYGELKKLSEENIKITEKTLELIYNGKSVSTSVATKHIELLQNWHIDEHNPMIRPPQQRARDRFEKECDFQLEEAIENQLTECEYALEFIAKAKNLNIANTVEKECYLSLLKNKYKQLLQHLLTLVQHCNFLDVENFLTFQTKVVEHIKQYAQTNSTTNEEQEAYKNILMKISKKLQEAIDTATQQITQLPLLQETNSVAAHQKIDEALDTATQQVRQLPSLQEADTVAAHQKIDEALDTAIQQVRQLPSIQEADTVAAYQKIQEALANVDKLGLTEVTKVHYRRLLLEAMRNLKNPSIQAAEARFFQHAFSNCSDIKGRRVLIQTALANVDNLNIQDELEVTHYCLLLTQASNHISRVCAENAFYNFYLTLKGDMPSRLYNILNKLTTLQEFLKNELEIMHFQALLIKAQKEFEPSIRLSIQELFSHPDAYARYKHVKKQPQPQFSNDIEKAYYEGNVSKLLNSHRLATLRLSISVKRFNAETDLSKRKDSIEKAIADIGNERIIDKDEEAIYLALLAEEKTKLESLSAGKKAAQDRFDKLKLFETDDYSQMECNIQAAFNEQSSISDAEEAAHFHVLLVQAQTVSVHLTSISQCMNDAENLVAKADGLCKTARIKTTAAKDLSASLEKAIEASYDLGIACQKLTTVGDEAYGIFPGMATDPVNIQTKIQQISANVQNMLASMQKQFQSIQDLCDQIVSKACPLQTEDNSQASQLAMLQQQLDKAKEAGQPEVLTRTLLMQMQQESTPKEVRLETAEEQRRHVFG